MNMKEKFIKSTLILLIGGFLTKLLGMLIKIVITRNIGLKGISLYMLVLPIFSLFISLGQIGLPVALARLVAMDDYNNKKLYFSIIPLVILYNVILTIIIIVSAGFISNYLFRNKDLYYSIVAIGLVIPFTSISSICRSYFFGKEKMWPHILSNIVEDLIRLLFAFFILPKFSFLNIKYLVFSIIIINIISEAFSTLVLIFFLPNKMALKDFDFSYNGDYVSDAMKIAIPVISSNLLGNIVYFLEPIILTNIFLILGYTLNYVTTEYGIITGYVIPLLLMPSFFTMAISQAILPYIAREYKLNNLNNIKKRINMILFFILLVGSIICIIFELFGNYLLLYIYKTGFGFNYLRILAPFCILQYIQAPIVNSLNAMGKSKDIFFVSLITSFFRITSLIFFSILKIGIFSYIFSMIFNILLNTFLLYRRLYSYL